MCGRFARIDTIEALQKTFLADEIFSNLSPSWNVAPGQHSVVFEGTALKDASWGYAPPWQKEKGQRPLINARLEGITEKQTFRDAIHTGRCIIPASGFYEWKERLPYYVYTGSTMALAGLLLGDEAAPSYVIITREADEPFSAIHHRQPLILSRDLWQDWLTTDNVEPLLKKLEEERVPLQWHQVSPQVNSPSFNNPACLEPWHNPEVSLF